MEINQMKYLVTIVESNFNISSAAKKLYTSQSSISQVILNIEKESGTQLFTRERGRLRSLTSFGTFIYQESIKILDIYDRMMERINEGQYTQLTSLKIGVPELIVKVYLEDFFLNFIKTNPAVRLEIVEIGSKDIAAMMEKNLLDFAILVEPTHLNPVLFNKINIISDNLQAFMSKDHALAEKTILEWTDLDGVDLALFHSDFITHHLVSEKLMANGLNTNEISITSSSWAFLVDMSLKNNMLTLLASRVKEMNLSDSLVTIPFADPIPFEVSVWSHKRDRTVSVEQSFIQQIQEFSGENHTKNELEKSQ